MYIVYKKSPPLTAARVPDMPHDWLQPVAMDGEPWIWTDPRARLDQTDSAFQTREQQGLF